MSNLFTYIDGKKTLIGSAFLFAAVFLSEVIVGMWSYTPDWIVPMQQTFEWVGMTITGIGGGHKILKSYMRGGKEDGSGNTL